MSVLLQHEPAFAAFNGNLGCTDLVTQDIPLLADFPIRWRYGQTPPSVYDDVRAHIRQLLDSQVNEHISHLDPILS